MSKTLNNVVMTQKQNTASTWTTVNPKLAKGQIGWESDTNKFKFGNGTNNWNDLPYAGGNLEKATSNPTTTDIDYDIGTLWLNTNSGKVFILQALTTTNSTTTATWSPLNADVVLPDIVDNLTSNDATKVLSAKQGKALKTLIDNLDTSVTANTNARHTHSNKAVLDATTASFTTTLKTKLDGIASGAEVNVQSDWNATSGAAVILNKPTLGTAASKNTGTGAGNIPILDANGKLNESVVPKLAITNTYEVASQAAMLALTAEEGDIAIRTDESKTYILTAAPASTLANWKELKTPLSPVQSVNGKTGAVTLNASDVGAEPTISTKGSAFNKNFEDTDANILMNGTADAGISAKVARADHVHPSDTTKQDKISASNKLSADLVDDTTTTHKFVSASEKNTWNGKQDPINKNNQLNAEYISESSHRRFVYTLAENDKLYEKTTGIYYVYATDTLKVSYGFKNNTEQEIYLTKGSVVFIQQGSGQKQGNYIIFGYASETNVMGQFRQFYTGNYNAITHSGYLGLTTTIDLFPATSASSGGIRLVTNGLLYDVLKGKQDTLIFDNTPTNGSSNPITSDGVYDNCLLTTDTLILDGGTDESST